MAVFYSLLICLNIATFLLYAYDKRCAVRDRWRVPEITLLSFTFFGGGLGALIAMYFLRHKTKHAKFQICVPLCLTMQILILIIINS